MKDLHRGKVGTVLAATAGFAGAALSAVVLPLALALGVGALLAAGLERRLRDRPEPILVGLVVTVALGGAVLAPRVPPSSEAAVGVALLLSAVLAVLAIEVGVRAGTIAAAGGLDDTEYDRPWHVPAAVLGCALLCRRTTVGRSLLLAFAGVLLVTHLSVVAVGAAAVHQAATLVPVALAWFVPLTLASPLRFVSPDESASPTRRAVSVWRSARSDDAVARFGGVYSGKPIRGDGGRSRDRGAPSTDGSEREEPVSIDRGEPLSENAVVSVSPAEDDCSRIATADGGSDEPERATGDSDDNVDDASAPAGDTDRSAASSSADASDTSDAADSTGELPSIVERVDEVLQRDDAVGEDGDSATDAGVDSRAPGDVSCDASDASRDAGDASRDAGDASPDLGDASPDLGDASPDFGGVSRGTSDDSDDAGVDQSPATPNETAAATESSVAGDAAGSRECQNCGATDTDCAPRSVGPKRLSIVLCEPCQAARTESVRAIDACRGSGVPLAVADADACEACGKTGPLEAHAVVPIDADGFRHQNNVAALCPTCHADVASHRDADG